MIARLGPSATVLAAVALVLSLFPDLTTISAVAAVVALGGALLVRHVSPGSWIPRLWGALASVLAVVALIMAVGFWSLIGGSVLVMMFTRAG